MKKWATISLLFLLLFNASAYFFVFKIQQIGLRKETKTLMRANPDKKSLVRISIPTSWLDNKDKIHFKESFEFEFDGKLYDIISTEKLADSTIYYCINDKNEEQLISKYKEDIKRDNDHSNPKEKSKRLSKLISQYLIPDKLVFEHPNFSSSKKITQKKSIYLSFIPDLVSPPPKA